VTTQSRSTRLTPRSAEFVFKCGIAGLVSSAVSHALITPLDVIKNNMQCTGADIWATTRSVTNTKSLLRGILPTTIGFGSHGVLKFGIYEALKHQFAIAAGPEHAARYRDILYSVSSASAELLASVVLCPFTTVAIRMQTNVGTNVSMSNTFANIVKQEGAGSLWSGLLPLWSRQIPYTMMKFVAFERIREYLDYATTTRVRTQHVFLPGRVSPREELVPMERVAVTVTAGFLTGALCTAISQPADVLLTLVSRSPRTTNVIVEARQILTNVGLTALTRGIAVRALASGSLISMQLFLYLGVKKMFDLPTIELGARNE